MPNIKVDAWRRQSALVDLDWREICDRYDPYPLANVLGEGPDVSIRYSARISLTQWIGGVMLVLSLAVVFISL